MEMMNVARVARGRRWCTVAVVVGLALVTTGMLTATAGTQASNAPGVTDKAITLGYISSETGVAASASEGSAAGCKARVGAENAKGGVNGRKIDLEEIDDKSSANLNSAKDLVENRDAFIVINDSPFAFGTYRYLKDADVPMLGGGFDGSYYYESGNENIVSAYGDGTPVPGLTYDNTTAVMKKLGAKSVGAVGYGISPSSAESAKAVETYGAKAQGLDSRVPEHGGRLRDHRRRAHRARYQERGRGRAVPAA